MTAVFLKLLNMSIAASWLVLAVMILRVFLKKAPSWIVCLLWGIVALRLLMPVTLESPFSLIPSAEVIPMDVTVSETPAIYSGIPAVNSAINPVVTQSFVPGEHGLEKLVLYATVIWLVGVGVMLVYSAVTYWKLHRQVSVSISYRENIYLCDNVESPFLLGIFRPRIYLPSDLPQDQQDYVLAHENAHIKRRDHLWKPLGFFLLTIYWFDPLLWVGYILLCRDIERACDERVIARMDPAGKVGYSAALVACSVHRRMVMACPVAFGETSVKSRIKAVLNYKKPVFWVVCMSVLVCVITAACFLTNPQICIHAYEGTVTTEPTCTETGLQTRVCSHCQHSYTVRLDRIAHTYDSGVVTEPATCTHQGSMVHACVICGDQKTQMLEKTAHTASNLVFVQEPNCTHEGSQSSNCSQCGTLFVTQILPVNHDHDLQETVLKAPTCEETGEGVLKCSRCDYSEALIYEHLPHDWKVKYRREATCSTVGYESVVCVNCGKETDKETPTSHSWYSYGATKKKCIYCNIIVPNDPQSTYGIDISTPTQPSLPGIQGDVIALPSVIQGGFSFQ